MKQMPNTSMYQEEILELYKNPLNYGTIEKPTHWKTEFNPLCGDQITIFLVVEKGKLKEIKFECQACAICTAAASLLTEKIKNKSVKNIEQMSLKDIEKEMGIKIIPTRIKCALLSLEAVKGALKK